MKQYHESKLNTNTYMAKTDKKITTKMDDKLAKKTDENQKANEDNNTTRKNGKRSPIGCNIMQLRTDIHEY